MRVFMYPHVQGFYDEDGRSRNCPVLRVLKSPKVVKIGSPFPERPIRLQKWCDRIVLEVCGGGWGPLCQADYLPASGKKPETLLNSSRFGGSVAGISLTPSTTDYSQVGNWSILRTNRAGAHPAVLRLIVFRRTGKEVQGCAAQSNLAPPAVSGCHQKASGRNARRHWRCFQAACS